jgi:hypothetical protein
MCGAFIPFQVSSILPIGDASSASRPYSPPRDMRLVGSKTSAQSPATRSFTLTLASRPRLTVVSYYHTRGIFLPHA